MVRVSERVSRVGYRDVRVIYIEWVLEIGSRWVYSRGIRRRVES